MSDNFEGYFISGPNASCVAHDRKDIEILIEALCKRTGDDSEDYTATKIEYKLVPCNHSWYPVSEPAGAMCRKCNMFVTKEKINVPS